MKRRDLLLIILPLLLAVTLTCLFFFLPNNETHVIVEVDGERYAALPLHRDAVLRIETEHGYNLLVIEGGEARITSADCHNQVCVLTGAIDGKMDAAMITCAPHHVIVYLGEE